MFIVVPTGVWHGLQNLGAGDALYMFTDGVTEARSPEMAYFEEKLAAALGEQAGRSAAEIVAARIA